MKLLVTVPWPERLGGAEAMLWNFLRNLDGTDVETTTVFFEPGSFERELAALPGVATEVIPVGRLRQLRFGTRGVKQLAELMRRDAPDVVLNWAAKAQIYGACAARLAGCGDRVIWWQHAIPSGHWLERLATLLPATAVGCSSTVAAEAQATMWPRRRTFVVHPGIEAAPVPAISREVLNIPHTRVVVGLVGRLQPWKGQDRLLRALAGLRDRGHDVHGLIVGGDAHGLSPEYPPYLEDEIRYLNLGDRVTMTGQVADARPYIAAMDILVSASVAEPFGIVLIEGMSQSVPLVAVGDGGARDIIEDDVSGLLVERPDAKLLAEGLEKLIVDDTRRRAIGAAGRERFLDHFTAPTMAENLVTQLEAVCGRLPVSAQPITA